MKEATIPKTFRIKVISVQKIEDFAKSKSISQGKAIDTLVDLATRYLEEKQLDKELDEISKDHRLMKEDLEWSELDLT